MVKDSATIKSRLKDGPRFLLIHLFHFSYFLVRIRFTGVFVGEFVGVFVGETNKATNKFIIFLEEVLFQM